jgi:hypothetical protein
MQVGDICIERNGGGKGGMRDFGEATDVVLVGVQAPVGQQMDRGLRESIAEALEEREEFFLQKRRFPARDSQILGVPRNEIDNAQVVVQTTVRLV